MSDRILRLAFVLCLIIPVVGCGGSATVPQPTSPPQQTEPPADWIAYVQAQAQALESIDPLNTDYSDLAFLAPLLQGKNIVELGESSHGVAEFSQVKIRLIKFLHEQLGYDVMTFESSILSTFLANEQASQLTPTAFMQDSIFAVWSTTDVLKLFSYIQSTQNTAHPLILTGMDVQLTTPWEVQARPGVFQQVVGQVDPVYAQQVHDMDQTFVQNWSNNNYILANYTTLKPEYQALTSFLDAHMAQIQSAYPTRPLFPSVVRQAAWGMGAFLDELYYLASSNPLAEYNARDAGMATNLELLIDNLYAGKKVMVWAHNSHIAHDAAAVPEWGWTNTGSFIFQKYGQAVYTVGLYMYQGSAAQNNRTVYTIPPAPDNSVEGLLHSAGDPYVFLDISTVTDWNNETAWMFQNFLVRDEGVTNSAMTLKNEYDGILQIDNVHPPTYVN
jgi:erythromycin esterase